MKVAQICTNVMSGSVGRIARQLYSGIRNHDDECEIFYGRGEKPSGYNACRFDNALDVYSHLAWARIADGDGRGSYNATQKLITRLKKFNPDIVHIHCLHGYYINYSLLFSYLREEDKKVIWTMHDCWAYTGHCAYYSYVGCEKWKRYCHNCGQKHTYPKSLLLDNSEKNFKDKKNAFTSIPRKNLTIVTPSRWLGNELKETFLSNNAILTINNGVNDVFTTYPELQRQNIILGVANIWDRRKGLNDFVELSELLPVEYRIVLVGVSQKQSEKLSKFNNITCIERTDSIDELVDLYNTSLILFNPTYEDNYPTVNIEAIACGLPVVTYRTGGSPELVEKTGFGTVVGMKDYKSVIEYAQQIKIDPLKKNVDRSLVSNDVMVNKYLKLYHEILQERPVKEI